MSEDKQQVVDVDVEYVEATDVQVVGDMMSNEFSVDALLDMAEKAPKIAAAMRKIQLASIAATNPQDWVDQGGKPYLQSSGSEKTAALWGISWQIMKQEKTTKADSYIWSTFLRIMAPRMGRTIEILGTRSSNDPFFGMSHNQIVPIEQIDEAAVRKSSYTNSLARGVQIMLGLRNLTWAELEAHGIKKGGVSAIPRTTTVKATEEEGAQRTEMWNMLLEISGGDSKPALVLLEEVSAFETKDGKQIPGVKKLSLLKGKRLQVNLGKVRDMHKIFLSDIAQGEQDEPESNETEASDG